MVLAHLYLGATFMFRKDANTARPLNGLQILDVGCGGGLVCEVSQSILGPCPI